jgi:hypothetical protein
MMNKSLGSLAQINRSSDRNFSPSPKSEVRDEHATAFGPDEGARATHTENMACHGMS